MLKNTFLHIPGIGALKEKRIWKGGVINWEDYSSHGGSLSLPVSVHSSIDRHLKKSDRALSEGNALFFENHLPGRELWRIYPEFSQSTLFLDIETTGLFPWTDEITLIGTFDGKQTKTFIKGKNLKEFPDELSKYSLIITYNGKCFDIPFVKAAFKGLKIHQAHLDLRWFLQRLGYSGGLKRIERRFGIQREKGLQGVDGFLAVLLWEEYKRGNKEALQALIRYNLEDVVNLRYILETAYNIALAKLPIHVKPIPVSKRPPIKIPYDKGLVEKIGRKYFTVSGA